MPYQICQLDHQSFIERQVNMLFSFLLKVRRDFNFEKRWYGWERHCRNVMPWNICFVMVGPNNAKVRKSRKKYFILFFSISNGPLKSRDSSFYIFFLSLFELIPFVFWYALLVRCLRMTDAIVLIFAILFSVSQK